MTLPNWEEYLRHTLGKEARRNKRIRLGKHVMFAGGGYKSVKRTNWTIKSI